MMKIPTKLLLSLIIFFLGFNLHVQASDEKIIVISSASNDIKSLNKKQVRQIFMGGVLSRKYTPVMQAVGNADRSEFNTKIIGLTENRIQAYWSQLLFTGRSTAPVEIKNIEELIVYLRKNTSAVSYISSEIQLPGDILVVYGD